jgi:hypothetical protein
MAALDLFEAEYCWAHVHVRTIERTEPILRPGSGPSLRVSHVLRWYLHVRWVRRRDALLNSVKAMRDGSGSVDSWDSDKPCLQ